MKVDKSFFLGHRGWADEGRIESFVAEMSEPSAAPPFESMLLFENATQHTWLIASANYLVCVLDDVRYGAPRLKWQVEKAELVSDGVVTAEIGVRPKSARIGKLDIGPRKGWLFSNALFRGDGPEIQVRQLIERNLG